MKLYSTAKNWTNRDPDWQRQEIEYCVRKRISHNRHNDDEWLCRGMRYLKKINNSDPDRVIPQLDIWRDIHNAWLIFTGEEGYNTRSYVEALILANEPTDEIAAFMTYDPEVIEAYEALFFDVRGISSAAVVGRLLSLNSGGGFATISSNLDSDQFLKAMAVSCGAPIVKLIINPVGGLSTEEMEMIRNQISVISMRKSLATMLALVPGRFEDSRIIMENYNQIQNRELAVQANAEISGISESVELGLEKLRIGGLFRLDVAKPDMDAMPATEEKTHTLFCMTMDKIRMKVENRRIGE